MIQPPTSQPTLGHKQRPRFDLSNLTVNEVEQLESIHRKLFQQQSKGVPTSDQKIVENGNELIGEFELGSTWSWGAVRGVFEGIVNEQMKALFSSKIRRFSDLKNISLLMQVRLYFVSESKLTFCGSNLLIFGSKLTFLSSSHPFQSQNLHP